MERFSFMVYQSKNFDKAIPYKYKGVGTCDMLQLQSAIVKLCPANCDVFAVGVIVRRSKGRSVRQYRGRIRKGELIRFNPA
jgi:hypothetical protein